MNACRTSDPTYSATIADGGRGQRGYSSIPARFGKVCQRVFFSGGWPDCRNVGGAGAVVQRDGGQELYSSAINLERNQCCVVVDASRTRCQLLIAEQSQSVYWNGYDRADPYDNRRRVYIFSGGAFGHAFGSSLVPLN